MTKFRFASAILTLCIAFGALIPLIPQKAQAQWAVFDAPNTLQNTMTSISSNISAVNTWFMQWKESVLDGIAYYIAKAFIRQITTDIVTWINNDFEGSPRFISDPGGFFKNMIDEEIGAFIEGSPLGFLCNQFSIDIRIQLALTHRPFKKRVTCTLSEIFGNVQGAAEDFTRGNFVKGGWAGWNSVSGQPQNNRYGAMLDAHAQMGVTIAGKQIIKSDEARWSGGFLSFKRCKPSNGNNLNPDPQGTYGPPTAQQAARERLEDMSNFDERYGEGVIASGEMAAKDRTYNESPDGMAESIKKCGAPGQLETATPGSLISNQLETVFGSPIREMELADEFNEIINALVMALVRKAMGGSGVLGMTQSGSADIGSGSFISQMRTEQDEKIVSKVRTEIMPKLDGAIALEGTYRAEAENAIAGINTIRNLFNTAESCAANGAATAGNSTTGSLYMRQSRKNLFETLLNEIRYYRDNNFQNGISPYESRYTLIIQETSANITSYNNIQAVLRAATSTTAVTEAATSFQTRYNPTREIDLKQLQDEKRQLFSYNDNAKGEAGIHRAKAIEFQMRCDRI